HRFPSASRGPFLEISRPLGRSDPSPVDGMAFASATSLAPLIRPHAWAPVVVRFIATVKTGDKSMLVPSPKWLDSGNNAWQLAAATFVGLQSIPGLAVLYA